jgi:hypothetical protein
VQWSRVEASAGATNWYGSVRQTTGYSDARTRRGDWAFSEPTPQLGDHRKSGGQLRGEQYGDVGSAQSDQSAGALAVQTAAPLRSSPRSCTASPTVGSTPQTRRSTTDPAPCKPPPSATYLAFEDMILLRTGGLAASPPLRYTLETAEQCLAPTVALLGSHDSGRSQTAQRCQIHSVRSATVAEGVNVRARGRQPRGCASAHRAKCLHVEVRMGLPATANLWPLQPDVLLGDGAVLPPRQSYHPTTVLELADHAGPVS